MTHGSRGPSMPTDQDDRYPPDEAQRRFEALIRAAANTPPLHLKDIPRKRPKGGKAVTPSPSKPS